MADHPITEQLGNAISALQNIGMTVTLATSDNVTATRKELSVERKRYQVALSNISDEASALVGPSAAALAKPPKRRRLPWRGKDRGR